MDKNIKCIDIINNEISPRLIKALRFDEGLILPHGYKLQARYVYDYGLEFYIESDGIMVIDGTKYCIKKGDIVFRKPGQYVQGIMPYSCYFIIIDLLGNSEKDCNAYNLTDMQSFQSLYANEVLDSIPPVFTPRLPDKYNGLFKNIYEEFLNKNEVSDLIHKSLILQILYNMYQDIKELTIPLSPYYTKVKRVTNYINKSYNKKIVLNDLAEIAGCSPNYFHKMFKNTIGMTPNEYIVKIRLDTAREKIINTELNICEISLQCGFENFSYFSAVFKRNTGITPKEFRKNHRYM